MDLEKLQRARTVKALVQQANDLEAQLANIKKQLKDLNLTDTQINDLVLLFDQVKNVMGTR